MLAGSACAENLVWQASLEASNALRLPTPHIRRIQMARRPASWTPAEARRPTTNRDNRQANIANVRYPIIRTRISAPGWDDAVRFHRLVLDRKGTEVFNAFKALLGDYAQNGLPLPEMARRASVLFKDDRDLILGFNQFLYPMAQIPVPVQNLGRVRIFANPGDAEQ